MDFRTYRKERLNEEIKNGEYFPDELERSELLKETNSMTSLMGRYFEKGKNGKASLVGFGSDIAEGINDFVKNKLVNDEDFQNADIHAKFNQEVRNKLEETQLGKLKDEFERVGKIIDGLLTQYTLSK